MSLSFSSSASSSSSSSFASSSSSVPQSSDYTCQEESPLASTNCSTPAVGVREDTDTENQEVYINCSSKSGLKKMCSVVELVAYFVENKDDIKEEKKEKETEKANGIGRSHYQHQSLLTNCLAVDLLSLFSTINPKLERRSAVLLLLLLLLCHAQGTPPGF